MKKHSVLISGPTIARDEELSRELKKKARVFKNLDNSKVISIIEAKGIDLLLLQVTNDKSSEIELVKNIKNKCPGTKIILINGNGNRDVFAKGFKSGIKDAFREPYQRDMVVERVGAILG